MSTQVTELPQVHRLVFRDGFFRCACTKIHPVKDIDDAREAQAAHESQAADEPAGNDYDPPELAAIRARHTAASSGPLEWVGTSLEQARGGVVIEAEVNCGSYCYGGSAVLDMSPADKDFTENAHVDLRIALAGLEAVINLHRPQLHHSGGVARRVCAECSSGGGFGSASRVVAWPCGTFSALRQGLATEHELVLRAATDL